MLKGGDFMGLFDVDGFGEPEKIKPLEIKTDKEVFVENSLDRSIVEKVNPLVKVEVINKRYNLGKLLTNLGIDISGSNMYCPFHPDEMTGKPSAKYHSDSDKVYCFSENKSYSAYHAIKLLYGLDIDKVFMDIWIGMPLEERHEVMDKYEDGSSDIISMPSEWDKYSNTVLRMFRDGKVNFRQHKNALYKVLMLVSKSQTAEAVSK